MNRLFALLAVCAAALTACDRPQTTSAASDLPTVKLNDAIGRRLGGPDTCVILLDASTGASRYQYGMPSVCSRPLPPCATFEIPAALIGLDAGLITPATVLKWDGSPQPVSAFEKDANLATAFSLSIGWWDQALAKRIGAPLFESRLKAFGYGSGGAKGPIDSFWMGPAKGGTLGVSTKGQAEFLQRLYDGRAAVKPQSAAAVTALIAAETRAGGVFAGKAAACDSIADSSRTVGWSVGRLTAPGRDLVFAASIEGQAALPGAEVQSRLKAAFAEAGLWPAG